jgi:hypothetical protein
MRDKLADIIRDDFAAMERKERLSTSEEVEGYLHLQSVEGHAHNGHGLFHKRRFVNITMGEICRALGKDPAKIRVLRQSLIDEVKGWVKAAENGKPRTRLVNDRGEPLYRVSFLDDFEVDPELVLYGLYYGGLRDDYSVRARAEKLYGIKIGGGECYAVNTDVMRKLGLDGDTLAHGEYADRIEQWKQVGLIVDPPATIDDDGPIQYIYIRHFEGPGHSDDLAIIFSGLVVGFDAALGAFLADATDTFEKFSATFTDQDTGLSRYIGEHFPHLNFRDDVLLDIARLATVPMGSEDELPDSSMRYLLLKDRRFHICALENHLNFLRGKPTVNIPVGIGRARANELYEYVHMLSADLVQPQLKPETVPAAETGLIGQLIDRNVKVLGEDATLAQIADALSDSEEDFVVIANKQGTPVGAVHARSIVNLLHKEK